MAAPPPKILHSSNPLYNLFKNPNPKTNCFPPNRLDPLEPWSNLQGKVVLVTGASSGLGLEFCQNLAKAGCRIVAAARRINHLKSLCDQINKKHSTTNVGTVAIVVELDVTAEPQAIKNSVDKAWTAFGHIDTLINNAGVRGTVKTSLDLAEEEWDKVIKTNLTGSWLVSKYIGRYMKNVGKGGSIINISSISGLSRAQFLGSVAHSSSKAAIDSMTKVMSIELGKHNIRVNSIAPGLFKSNIAKDLMKNDWLQTVAIRGVPLKTFGTSDPALTSLVRFLIHDSSKYTSGNIFVVDAGASLPGFPLFSSL